MKVQILSFHCVLKNKLGQVISSSFNHDVINQSEKGSGSLPGLIAGLQDLKDGDKRQVELTAAQAYGFYDPNLVVEVYRHDLDNGQHLVVGNEIIRFSPQQNEERTFRVTNANKTSVTLDGNHPLAGQDLVFDIEVVSAREAIETDFDESEAPKPTHYLH